MIMKDTRILTFIELVFSKVFSEMSYAICSILMFALVMGCGESKPTRVVVSGKVLIDGKPLTHGIVRFIPEHGRPSSSAVLSDGTFDLASTTWVRTRSKKASFRDTTKSKSPVQKRSMKKPFVGMPPNITRVFEVRELNLTSIKRPMIL